MSEEILLVDDDIKYHEQFLPPELTPASKSTINKIFEDFNFALSNDSAKSSMVVEEARYTIPTQLTNSFDRENWTVSTDHCYARPWNWRPEASFLRPTKTLFIPKLVPVKSSNSIQDNDDAIDIESEVEVPAPNYDVAKAKSLMEECEKHAFSIRADTEEDWEEKVSKLNWTTGQHKLFNTMVNILNSFNLSKLAYENSSNEPLLRRTIIDKAVQRVRRLLASVLWDSKLTQWLHQILIENLGPHYLAFYLDILQTLKSKLPNFVDKMMHTPTSTFRAGCINSIALTSLLERPWDPVSTTLMQDKPKKLPGNPVIIVVPSGPTTSKTFHKWRALLTNLGTVVTVPTNFGSTGHRLTMPSILDQLFSITRGKIQDVRDTFPGRNIILVGFNSGAALALQVAHIEPVLCVISVGFSLLTAEGLRGEPDDNVLELQCPVLFVIGQCSNSSSQEDLEDMRERMRVETGLLVVGSADDYLRVSKKKRRQEGITQSIVDRCILDEMGEFISGLILSPFPPQIRQSPTHVPPETPIKKGNPERKRYSSNASSLDSEPPSPTPVRMNKSVGRPPGSKSKNRLEAKWAQQIAQGNLQSASSTNPPSPSPIPHSPIAYPAATASDTSSNDGSSAAEKPPKPGDPPQSPAPPAAVKKLKTLLPVEKPSQGPAAKNQHSPARMHAFGMGRNASSQGNTSVTNLLQGGIKTIPPSLPKPSTSGIKVLEHVTIHNANPGKLLSNRTIDLSKITLLNSSKASSPAVSNVLLLPDNKIKTIGSGVKGASSGGNILLPMSPSKGTPKTAVSAGPKYITAKRQLMNQKPPRTVKKPIYMPATNLEPPLPPPTNLTTQDIMDLPIIFADDNQLLGNAAGPADVLQTSAAVQQASQPSKTLANVASTKYMLVNKQTLGQGNYILTPSIKKGSPVTSAFNKPTPKYTKIILSSKKNNAEDLKPVAASTPSKIQCLSPEITVKKVLSAQGQLIKSESSTSMELVDLENEIKATAVPKPNLSTSDVKNIKIIPKLSTDVQYAAANVQKRPSMENVDEGDPDYVPPKSLKLE
ncbi:unnamed protein product [Phyllotreta striolata]|uniref:KANSL3 helical domain-containing protein n=1 Tax=Phyllotreta striolata TaxID=444603 RepID=A0A9N9TJV1_PHYSR|nr:unnamed protein product [Phyllotreta striolata]